MARYEIPQSWTSYDVQAILTKLVDAKSMVKTLTSLPVQRTWAVSFAKDQQVHEVLGTVRIQGETDRRRKAAARAYDWLKNLPAQRPIDRALILFLNQQLVSASANQEAIPGQIRSKGDNATFGNLAHRGAKGGKRCAFAFEAYCQALATEFEEQDPLIAAFATHYHLTAMHPFMEANGRTARALEALLFQRMGLRDGLFLAMSAYHNDDKAAYLEALAESQRREHDLTPFLRHSLHGVCMQGEKVLRALRKDLSHALYREMIHRLFNRTQSTRQRLLAERQLDILKLLLEIGERSLAEVLSKTRLFYRDLGNPDKAQIRDLNHLLNLGALTLRRDQAQPYLSSNLAWPQQLTETEFHQRVVEQRQAKIPNLLT